MHRPWGKYTVLHEAPQFKVKRIEVNPGKKLSLQMHHKRSEHWVVVQRQCARHGRTSGQPIWAQTNRFTFRCKIKHRIENATDQPLTMVEVAVRGLSGRRRHRSLFGRFRTRLTAIWLALWQLT